MTASPALKAISISSKISSDMPPIMYQIAGGNFFLPGAALLIIAVLLGLCRRRRWISILQILVTLLGISMVTLSATSLPWWMYSGWTVATCTWICSGYFNQKTRTTARCAMLLTTLVLAGVEISYQWFRPLSAANYPRLYVIGDSISAGLGRSGEKTWPAILREEHGVEVIDLSRAGCTINQAASALRNHQMKEGLVLIEIGGNDILGKANASRFGSDLDSLIQATQSPTRKLVMVELPLFPFDNAYGIEQRRVATRFQIPLIPRRCLASILASPNATVDGIHLSNTGQRLLAELVWKEVGPAMGKRK